MLCWEGVERRCWKGLGGGCFYVAPALVKQNTYICIRMYTVLHFTTWFDVDAYFLRNIKLDYCRLVFLVYVAEQAEIHLTAHRESDFPETSDRGLPYQSTWLHQGDPKGIVYSCPPRIISIFHHAAVEGRVLCPKIQPPHPTETTVVRTEPTADTRHYDDPTITKGRHPFNNPDHTKHTWAQQAEEFGV